MNTDVQDYTLPPDVFTLVQNGTPIPGSIRRGQVLMLANPAITDIPASTIGMFISRIGSLEVYYLFYTDKVRIRSAFGLEDITRAAGDYTGGVGNRWNAIRFNEYIVATNNVDQPQAAVSALSSHADLVALTAWPASTQGKIVYAFKNFLNFANVTKSSVNHPRLVKWSQPAASGLPTSWDEADPTKDAGEVVLWDGDAPITCAAPLNDMYALYTDRELWVQRFVGGQAIFAFHRILSDTGAYNSRSVVPVSPGRHIVLTGDFDVVETDGNTAESITTPNIRKYMYQYFGDVFELVHDAYMKEVWIAHANANGMLTYNKALVWNYRYRTWAIHDLPTTYSTAYGFVNHPVVIRGDALNAYSPAFHSSVGGNSRLLYPTARSSTEQGRSSYVYRLERTGLSVKGAGQDGSPIIDYDTVAMFQEFRPRFSGTVGDTVAVSFGVRQTSSEAVSFGSPTNFTVGSSLFLPIQLTGRLLDIRMDFTHLTHDLTLEGYDLDVAPLARH